MYMYMYIPINVCYNYKYGHVYVIYAPNTLVVVYMYLQYPCVHECLSSDSCVSGHDCTLTGSVCVPVILIKARQCKWRHSYMYMYMYE